jgi:hypothetical protein
MLKPIHTLFRTLNWMNQLHANFLVCYTPSRQRYLKKGSKTTFSNLTFVSEPTQARTRAGTRNQGAGAGEVEADDIEEDLTDDESVVIREAPPPPQPRRSSGNCNF